MRILGLDITAHGVFGVEIDSAFGRFEVRDSHEILLDPNQSNDPAIPFQTAKRMIEGFAHPPDKVVTAVPSPLTTFRNLAVATKDRKSIKNVLEFELEDDLPFSPDNLHYDSSILPTDGAGSLIHVAATNKERFAEYLARLQEASLDPHLVTTEAWAYRGLLSRMEQGRNEKTPQRSQPLLLVSIEKTSTIFYIHLGDRPIIFREISFGADTLFQALRSVLNANPDQIQAWIENLGLTQNADPRVAQVITQTLETLLPDLKQAELAARPMLQDGIDRIYVTGELAHMPGLIDWFRAATGKEASLFCPLSRLDPSGISYSELSEIRFAKAFALALTPIVFEKVRPINLRKGIFSRSHSEESSYRDLAVTLIPYAFLVLAVFSATKAIEYQYFKSKYAEANETLKKAVKNYYQGASDNAVRLHLSDVEKLKKTIQSDLMREREMAKLFSENPNSPIDVLKDLSSKISKDIVVDFTQFSSGSTTNQSYQGNLPVLTNFTVLISNPQLLVKLNEVLEKNFGIKKEQSKEVTQEGRKLFEVRYSGTTASKGKK